MSDESQAGQWRKQVTSATYFLVFHRGMTIAQAENFLADAREAIPALAKRGSEESRKCFTGLSALIGHIENKGKTTFEWVTT